MIKRALHNAEHGLWHILASADRTWEYAASVWDPSLAYLANIKMVQHRAIRYISKIKGRRSITEARNKLELEMLAHRRAKIRHTLLLRILSKQKNDQSLSDAYNELLSDKQDNASLTRATTRGLPLTITAKTSIYRNILPKSVRELKLNANNLTI